MSAVVQAPAFAQALIISVVVQSDGVGVGDYQIGTVFTTQLHGLSVWDGHLFKERS